MSGVGRLLPLTPPPTKSAYRNERCPVLNVTPFRTLSVVESASTSPKPPITHADLPSANIVLRFPPG